MLAEALKLGMIIVGVLLGLYLLLKEARMTLREVLRTLRAALQEELRGGDSLPKFDRRVTFWGFLLTGVMLISEELRRLISLLLSRHQVERSLATWMFLGVLAFAVASLLMIASQQRPKSLLRPPGRRRRD